MAAIAISTVPVGHSAAAQQSASSVPLLTELEAVHPYALPGTVAASRDGSTYYAAEGGAIAILTDQGIPDPTSPGEFVLNPALYRGPVGSRGVLPVAMVLDPAADPSNDQNPNNLLYIAGGRDGLWAMDAVANGTVHKPYRIDDSGNQNPATQNARRWCADVAVFTVNGVGGSEDFVAVLGARKDASRLRIHKLSDVRGVAALGQEFGNELSPHLTVSIDRRPGSFAPPLESRSFAYSMAVDELPGTAGTNIYVAMGTHGLVRVPLAFDGTSLSTPGLNWGPVFGENSWYKTNLGALYGDRKYREGANPQSSYIDYHEAPYFLDVAVDSSDPQHHRLYVAVDHLGWCAFDLEASWSEQMPASDFHHEGVSILDGASEPVVGLWTEMAYARRVELTTTTDAQGQNPHSTLVVGCTKLPFLKLPDHMNEGRTLTYAGEVGPFANADVPSDMIATNSVVLAYDVDKVVSWTNLTRHDIGVSVAGAEMHVIEDQPPGELTYISNGLGYTPKFFYDVDAEREHHDFLGVHYFDWRSHTGPNHGPDKVYQRRRNWRRGRQTFNFSPSLLNPELMITSSNDNSVAPDGPLVLDIANGKFLTHFQSAPGTVNDPGDNYFNSGVIANADGGIVLNDGTADFEYRLGFKQQTWRVTKIDGGSGITNPSTTSPPVQVYEQYLVAPVDKFNHLNSGSTYRGRHYQTSTATFPEYNAYLAGLFDPEDLIPDNILWVSHNGTPQGIWALDPSIMRTLLDSGTPGDVHRLDDATPNNMVFGALTTHPEFWNVEDVRTTNGTSQALEFIHNPGGINPIASPVVGDGQVNTYFPDMTKLSSVEGGPADTWVLVVPCSRAALSELNPYFPQGHAAWLPDDPFLESPQSPLDPGFNRMMLRVFDVNDPTKIEQSDNSTPNSDSNQLEAYTILGPAFDGGTEVLSNAYKLKTVHATDSTGTDRCFVFVADFGGYLYVYELTDVLYGSWTSLHPTEPHFGPILPKTPVITYSPKSSLTDDIRNNLHGVEIDVLPVLDAQGNYSHDEVRVYISVSRVGVEVLDFQVEGPGGQPSLTSIRLIQTSGEMGDLRIADHPLIAGEKLLFVSDYPYGLRVYGYGN